MAVVERKTDAIQPEAFEELRISIREEIFQKLSGVISLTWDYIKVKVLLPCRRRAQTSSVRSHPPKLCGFDVHNRDSLDVYVSTKEVREQTTVPEIKFSMLVNRLGRRQRQE